jgi:hypothetical protein
MGASGAIFAWAPPAPFSIGALDAFNEIYFAIHMNRAVRTLVSLVAIVVAGALSTLRAQVLTSSHVPVAIRHAFQAKFPAVRSAAWKIKSDGNYEAEFTLKRREIAVKFDVTGKWIETESAIPRRQLPTAVSSAIAQKFEGYKLIETQTVQRWNESRLIYEVHLETAGEIVKLQMYDDGTIVNQSAKEKTKTKASLRDLDWGKQPAVLRKAHHIAPLVLTVGS